MHNLLQQNNQRHSETVLEEKVLKMQNSNKITKELEEDPINIYILKVILWEKFKDINK